MLLIQHFSPTPSKLKTQIYSLTLIMSDKWVICSTRNTGCAIVIKCRAKFEFGIPYWWLWHNSLLFNFEAPDFVCTHSVWLENFPRICPTSRSHYCRDKLAVICSKGNLVELSLHKQRLVGWLLYYHEQDCCKVAALILSKFGKKY